MASPSKYARIIGTGHYLPENVVTNKDLESLCDTSDEWVRERTGIEQRHFAAEGQGCSDMAVEAAKRALESAGLEPTDIDMVIVATCTADYRSPSVAALVQDKLGCDTVCAFDITAACTGFLYTLQIGEQFVKTGAAGRVLIIGAERMSSVLDYEDRTTAVLFGDGAGAAILEGSEETGLLASNLYADGSKGDILTLTTGTPVYEPVEQANRISMNGPEVFKSAVRGMGDSIVKTIDDAGLTLDDVDWLVPHQANMRIIQSIGKRIKIPDERVVITVNKTANNSGATVPVALDIAIRDGRIKKGDTIAAAAFGAGLVWGAAVFTL